MANPEHLNILKKGPDFWNQWRIQNGDVKPDLSDADLSKIELSGATFTFTDLSGAKLYGANFLNMDLRWSILRNAELSKTNLSRVKLQGADLSGARLILTTLVDADLEDAIFSDAILGWTILGNNDLSSVKGLETVQHVFPSTIGIDTVYLSKGNIPEVFLRKAGVPENFIAYMRSLTGQAFEFYKCFISFTEADDAFSERLYNDLQASRVRCWRWKEDAKWGKTLMRSIDEAVHVYDKLVVICSEHSLNSPAVVREIERALQKEDKLAHQGIEPEVLFPIRLDDYIFTGWNHPRKADLTVKHVGDFRMWKESEMYRKGLDRLLRDLMIEKKA